jgi:ribokinase
MRILNFGSLNLDHVYNVDHFVRPGETLGSLQYHQFCGGKGGNQSIALARAGAHVHHAGKIGRDGLALKERLEKDGVDTSLLEVVDGPSGHAIIQVIPTGENSIIIHGGANQTITGADAERILSQFDKGDFLLLQNEISAIPEILECAAARGLTVVFNPAPMTPSVGRYPLERARYLVVNEVEGATLTGETDPTRIILILQKQNPYSSVVLTLGARGVWFADGTQLMKVPANKVKAVDTTAAGDTFIGYFLAGLAARREIQETLLLACRAAAICVMRPGAADSIPTLREVETFAGFGHPSEAP